MFDTEIEAMLQRPVRSIILMVAIGTVGLIIAYAIHTYGFPLIGRFKW